ncbi:MAG: alpha/beta hydrolase [Burkholderiaceae bacterium]|nr:alpha/beta hydrolase [Burkholderiaceae bacterium]
MTTILIIPGLREHVAEHWQTHLAERLSTCRTVVAPASDKVNMVARLHAIDEAVETIEGPIIAVAHSAGVAMFVHWVNFRVRPIDGALLVTPPDLSMELPQGYPSLRQLAANGWLPVPRKRLPFPSIVAASDNDHLASFGAVEQMARDWGSRLHRLGSVGHMNPASGYGDWPAGDTLISGLRDETAAHEAAT